ncbi:MAG: HPr family phosphocarrier protein [Acidobacteria bacterium]|nr:MAG: HPr family phosphocarrier protein [Acidobacteriota bacterium]RPJ62883.1 MAG: HPr family phosphocarrier protein [Acidobacteriota bacterium]
MLRRVIRVENQLGLHARAAARLVRTASRFESQIKLTSLNNDKETDGKDILGVMLLAASCGTELQITAEGVDEEAAIAELVHLVEENFQEPK